MIVILVAVSFSHSAAFAAEKMKPGLWEVTMQSDEMKATSELTSEQFEQMRSAGVHVPEKQPQGVITKICVTQAMADSGRIPIAQNESDCQPAKYRRKGSNFSVDIVCKGPHVVGNGKVNGILENSRKFTSNYQFKGTAHGKPYRHRHGRTGQWLDADCGNVKPVDDILKK